MRTHNLCFRAKIRKKCIPLYNPVSLYIYIKVGYKGVYITRTCFHDAVTLRVYIRTHKAFIAITITCLCNIQRILSVICFYFLLIFAQNIDCWYMLEPPNEYP